MSRKTDEELLAELESLGVDDPTAAVAQANIPTPNLAPAPKAAPPTAPAATAKAGEDDDVLRDLQAQLAAKPSAGTSRPTTPRLSSSTTSGGTKRADHTPASSGPPSGRSSEERVRNAPAPARTSGEGRAYHQSYTPGSSEGYASVLVEPEVQEKPAVGGGGGWWGSIYSTATAAVKQAESLAKEIRGNEEAQRWAEQMRGNMKNLQSLGTDLTSKALPTFTSLISHIAPPISAHERLQIHTTHDIQNYPSLDPLIYSTFSRIMAQVEGGDLMVIQRGSESRNRPRTTSEPQGYRGGVLGGGNGWTDGPWWRDEHLKRSVGTVQGLKEGSRLARVSAESYAREFFEARGGVEEAARWATETLEAVNPTRSSDIFLAIQAISYMGDQELFAGDAREDEREPAVIDPDEEDDELVCFAVYLHDPIHSLSFSALSQSFPAKWTSWLDASINPNNSNTNDNDGLPDSILSIISSGGVDPREWVAEWLEEVLSLSVGVVAQRYVARRMGVGEGGGGGGVLKGKMRVEEEGVGGEAARAI